MSTLLFHDRYLDYNFGPEHPFSPLRQEMMIDLLEALGHPIDPEEPPIATWEDVLRVHAEKFVEKVESASDGTSPPNARRFGINTGDVPVFEGMHTATCGLVGGTLYGAHLIAEGDAMQVLQVGGGLHHARRARASGFCVYNDLSVAIDALREEGIRVAYIDVDVHHGDGVQFLHYEDPGVLTISLHETGRTLFPGTGGVEEIGRGPGEGAALNVPLEPFTPSGNYLEVFERVIPYALEHFEPDVIVAQCGADAHFSDPLAHLRLTTQTYETIFRQLLDLADEHTDGRCLFTLGGGYRMDAVARIWAMLALIVQGHDLPEAIPSDWRERWQARIDEPLTATFHDPNQSAETPRRSAIESKNHQTSKQVLEVLARHWY